MANRVQIIFDALDRSDPGFKNLNGNLSQTSSAMKSLAGVASLVGVGFGALALKELGQEVFDAGVQWQRMTNAMTAATGSAPAAAAGLDFVRAEAKRLGLDLEVSAQGFSQLSAAAKGTGIDAAGLKEIFLGVSEASTVLSLSSADSEGALRAITQIMSKGTVQAEELRGQLGERIPGAFQIAARAMGVSTAELNKMLEQGQVLSDDFLPKFAAELRKTYADALPGALESTTAESNRLKTAWFELMVTLGDSTGFTTAATDGIAALASGVDRLRRAIKETNEEKLDGLQLELKAIEEQIDTARKSPAFIQFFYGGIDHLEERAKKLREEIAALQSEMDKGKPKTEAGGSPPTVKTETEEERKQREKTEDEADKRRHELKMAAADFENRQRLEQEKATAAELKRLAAEADEADRISFENRKDKMDAENAARKEAEAAIVAGLRRQKEEAEKVHSEITQFGIQAARNIQSAFADFLFDPFEDGLDGMLQSFGDMLRRMLAEIAANQILTSIFNGLAGSTSPVLAGIGKIFGGTAAAPAHHAGGKFVPAFHFGGLSRDEGFAVLQKGEVVFDPDQTKLVEGLSKLGAAVAAGGRGGAPVVEIHNYSGQPTRTESGRGPDGRELTRVIIGEVDSAMGRGAFDRTMKSVYGVTRQGVTR